MSRDPVQILAERNPAKLGDVERNFTAADRAVLLDRVRRSADADSHRKPQAWFTRVPWAARAAVGATILIAIGAYLIGGGGSAQSPTVGPQFAAAAVRVAEVNPRILLAEPGWKIVHVEPLQANSGETQFSDGTSTLAITWYPARLYADYREDRARLPVPDEANEVLGLTATTVHYGGSKYATMLPPQGDVFIEIRGDLGSREAYDAALASLQMTDVDTWLSAMPADIVRPDQQPQLVESLLEGVPLPPGFNRAKLENAAVLNPDGIRYEVADQVACGWLDSWAAADAAGDEKAMAAAVAAMQGAASWPVLREKPPNGDTKKIILRLANEIAHGRLDRSYGSAMSTDEDGKTFEYGPAYALRLSCDSVTKRETSKPFG